VIWLVGGTGLLGREVGALLRHQALPFHSTGSEVDIADEARVLRAAQEWRPSAIVNCAAYTAVDRAESEPERAFAVNATGPRNLARAARALGARIVHVSTDYVFSGTRQGPYPEDAHANPVNLYGRSKAEGEDRVREECPEHFVVRTAWVHAPHGRNFVGMVLEHLRRRKEMRVVKDQWGSPTYAADLAEVLLGLVTGDVPFGVYHYTNQGSCTRYEEALEIRRGALDRGLISSSVAVEGVASADFPAAARRPARVVLSLERIRGALRLRIPGWQDGIARHLDRLLETRDS